MHPLLISWKQFVDSPPLHPWLRISLWNFLHYYDVPANTKKENQNKMSTVTTGGFKSIYFVKIFIPDTITVC